VPGGICHRLAPSLALRSSALARRCLVTPYSSAQHIPPRQPSPRRVVYATSETGTLGGG
jgi:hypothetical protein